MAHLNLPQILVGITVLLLSNAIKVMPSYPDKTGGYAISIALEENIPEPVDSDNTAILLENIKTSIDIFSGKLWETSKNRFYIKSADILIPTSWNKVNSSHSTYQNYAASTIRISSSELVQVDNPFECGKPGNFIQLSLSFFNNSDSGRYGPNWKALLNLWASYRWGVHEEHGYIGDLKFPYAHRNSQNDEWEVTGCSDEPITGHYLDNETRACSALDTLDVSSTCRFFPDQSVNATTSLMHFHWIDSIVNFCDETNHNILSPNRQNSLCDHKSIWEVIRETRDFQMVTAPLNSTLPPVEFEVVQHSKKPSLYILLDRGSIQGSIGLASQIPRALIDFLSRTELYDTVAAVSSYPSPTNADAIFDEIEWSTVGDNLERFIDVIGNVRINGPLQRNFAQAILAAVNKIKAKDHPNGIVMLVLKFGGVTSSFLNYPPEAEVVQALNEQGIILNSIELRIANHSGFAHLSELARGTGGLYTVIANYGDSQTALSNVFWYMNKILSEDYKDLRKPYRTILKTYAAPGSLLRFKVPKSTDTSSNEGKVEMYFSSQDGSLSINDFLVEGVSSMDGSATVIADLVVRKQQDWMEVGSKWTYSFEISSDKILGFSEITIRTECWSCQGTMLVRTNLMDDSIKNVTLSVFTNARDSSIDFSINEPVILYAKIFKASFPVTDAQLLAFITETNSQATSVIRLLDNGEGSPDLQIFDGIYSGYFVPSRDGIYKISVSVEGTAGISALQYPINQRIYSFGNDERRGHTKMLPIDQDMGCKGAQCDLETLPSDFMQSVDLFSNLIVSNTADYSPEPTKISRFIISHDTGLETLTYIWIAPTIPGSALSVSSYDIRQSSSKENLITDFDNQEQVPGLSGIKPGAPGSVERFTATSPLTTTFYAIRSVTNRGRKSKISEVQAVEIREDESTTTTSTTPPTSSSTPSTVSSTTTDLTTNPGSSGPTTPSTTPTGSTVTPTVPTDDTNPSTMGTTPASTTKKPWAKTGGGIAVITVIVIIVVAAIAFAAFYVLKMRGSSKVKINPPPQPRTSIPS